MAGNEHSWFARRGGREDSRGGLIHYLQGLRDIDPARGFVVDLDDLECAPNHFPPFTVRAIQLWGLPTRASPCETDLTSLP
jgi:hypothetical protein